MVSFTPPTALIRRKSSRIRWTEGWLDPRAGLDAEEEMNVLSLLGIELRFLGHPTLNQVTIIDHTIPTPSFSLEFSQL
jgi:hypothetical protein